MKRTYLIDFIIVLILMYELIVTRNLLYALFLLLYILLFVVVFVASVLSANKMIVEAQKFQSNNEFDKATGTLLCLPIDVFYERKKQRVLNDERLVTILLSGDIHLVNYIIEGYKDTKKFSLIAPVSTVVIFLSGRECEAVFSGKKHFVCVINDAIYYFQKGNFAACERLCTKLWESDVIFYKWFCAYMNYRISVLKQVPDTDQRERALALAYNDFMKNALSIANEIGGIKNDKKNT